MVCSGEGDFHCTRVLTACAFSFSCAQQQGRHGQALPGRLSQPNLRAVLLDTRGPEIRTGKLRNDATGKETIHLQAGSTITLQTSHEWRDAGSTSTDLFVDYANIAKCLHLGMKVLLDDGTVRLTVQSANPEQGSVACIIDNSGEIRSRAGVNLPGAETDMPAMSEKDRIDIKYGLQIGVDYVAASFIQNAAGVREIRSYMKHVMTNEMGADWDMEKFPIPLIISKIESVSALQHFDEILEESDGVSNSADLFVGSFDLLPFSLYIVISACPSSFVINII